ncbi:TPA: ribose-phosphate pyrophosphokinase [Legionella anisa]|uniref:ribose-phosphate pyrophosphokinase n=1 Tax=Legionella anisa TaxID=28082 RepID=UPI00197D6ACA|nr:ribose-phosphate pyrophosphokinase [Legionella anisa]MBN5937612.1 ribose-phosphate pyrophosphokinase [Legionella anisa]
MKPILFSLFERSELSKTLIERLDVEVGDVTVHCFPDQEWYIKINSDIKNRDIIVVTSFNQPDEKILPLYFFAQTAKELGVAQMGLIAPYLAYLRQDTQFHPGEGVTSRYFANLLSQSFHWLMTIDPHLHRYKSLSEIYAIPTLVVHATDAISRWIQKHINHPVIIGPDMESEQWVAEIAKKADAPYTILEKVRHGDKKVTVSIPKIPNIHSFSPVLVDDIIATGRTMVQTVLHLKNMGIKSVTCIGVHALFAEDAYTVLLDTKIAQIITCNTIHHETNEIDMSSIIVDALVKSKLLVGLIKK